jgi:hypothetical protein
MTRQRPRPPLCHPEEPACRWQVEGQMTQLPTPGKCVAHSSFRLRLAWVGWLRTRSSPRVIPSYFVNTTRISRKEIMTDSSSKQTSYLSLSRVTTQPSLVASKGIHGSTLFTLSLPVSRLRLMSVRAAIGWLEGAGVIGVL